MGCSGVTGNIMGCTGMTGNIIVCSGVSGNIMGCNGMTSNIMGCTGVKDHLGGLINPQIMAVLKGGSVMSIAVFSGIDVYEEGVCLDGLLW